MKKITVVMLASQTLALLGFASSPVALMSIQNDWGLSNFQSGLIASAYFLGYVMVVPFATTLTDRIDAKKIYLLGGLLSALGLLCFGMLANNYPQAGLCMLINGGGFACLYMPGLKIISDRLDTLEMSRPIAFYTAFFGVGTGFSYFISGMFLPLVGWRMVLMGLSCGPLLALGLVYFLVKDLNFAKNVRHRPLEWQDLLPLHKWKEVLENRSAKHFILGYGIHCLELFASRNWIVAYLIFCSSHGQAELGISYPVVAGLIGLIGVPASILGNESAVRWGRENWIHGVMLLSCMAGIALSWTYDQPWWLIMLLATLHMVFIMADSSTLTAGLVMSAKSDIKGAAMGLHSLTGFVGGLVGPSLFGFVLDWTKKANLNNPWTYAYGSIVISSFLFVVFHSMLGVKSRSRW